MQPLTSRMDRLIGMLAEAVGEPAARAAVSAAAASCGLDANTLTAEEEQEVIARIARSPGLIGITAQLIGARLRLEVVRRRSLSEGRGAR